MIVVVNDANILIDIIELEILDEFFSLDFQFCTTDLIIYELNVEQSKALETFIERKCLNIETFSNDEMNKINEINIKHPGLSKQDVSAFYQAKNIENSILVTGDKSLRKYAKSEGICIHGHLWVFDKLIENKLLTPNNAINLLTKLCDEINPKLGLPYNECKKRIEFWSSF